MNGVTHINGHPSHHALQETRNAKARIGDALNCALKYLQMAHTVNTAHSLGIPLPSDKELAEAVDRVARELYTPPGAA